MTNRQRLEKLLTAESYLKQTKAGYAPDRPWWKRAMPLLWEVRMDLGSSEDGVKLANAHGILQNTEKGYSPTAPRWKKAMALIDEVQANLEPILIPALGPVKPGGKSVLLYVPTHNSDGFDGVWPAYDDTNVRVGTRLLAPEACRVIDHTGSAGGVGFIVRGQSGILHLFLHQATRPRMNEVFLKGEQLSTVARISAGEGGPHIHHGMDTRPLIGKWLKYGRNGNGPDYTYGSPTVGKQLAAVLAA